MSTSPCLPLSYYQKLFTSEYQLSPKLLAWAAVPLNMLGDACACAASFTEAFSLDTAIGPQLDMVGQIVGASRVSPVGVLTDDQYRLFIKATIIQNNWNGKIDGLQAAWRTLFPGGRIIINDQQNMTAQVLVSGAFDPVMQQLILGGYIVPRPEGVQYTYTLAKFPMLGFDRQDATVSGFDQGYWT